MYEKGLFEAIIVDINYSKGVCSISPIDPRVSATIDDVPIPYLCSSGNAGIFYSISIGTRVIAGHTLTKSRETTVIVGLLLNQGLLDENFISAKSLGLPSGTVPYPDMEDGTVVLRGGLSNQISLSKIGDINLELFNKSGIKISKNENKSYISIVNEDFLQHSNATKTIAGSVRRLNNPLKNIFQQPESIEMPLFADPDFFKKAEPLGFFNESRVLKRSYGDKKRNPEISEYRFVINEFSTDSMFTGFDDEVDRISNSKSLMEFSETYKRNREQSNVLHMAEHELIEIVGGNLVDINGNILDLNYRPIFYSSNGNKVPNSDYELSMDRAKRISRRGVGYHFQLSTNTKSDDESTYENNFVFDVDKEGVLKLHIPKSTNTGNIPYVSNINYVGKKDSVEVSIQNASLLEEIPVHLRDENGKAVIPNVNSITHRKTGIRFYNGSETPYFPSDSSENIQTYTRVNSTEYHDLTTAAERLIANSIRSINIPSQFVDDNGLPESTSANKPFEIYSNLANDTNIFPNYMGAISVSPGPSAIYSGGGFDGISSDNSLTGTVIAGIAYTDDDLYPAYSNSFTSLKTGDEISIDIGTEQEKFLPAGGKSANIALDGSLELSIGKDNFDKKSLSLDLDGSMVSWFGKDRNGRSIITQTDGDFLLNVGGSYSEGKMNKGRLEIRVNVVDKKFVATTFNDDESSPKCDSDYVISISEAGLVIAGMKRDAPMIIRNDGPLLLESGSSDVTIKGVQVHTVTSTGVMKAQEPANRN